ncbi:MAG: alpha/beta hydrolase, partial [Myxococcota bacterium]
MSVQIGATGAVGPVAGAVRPSEALVPAASRTSGFVALSNPARSLQLNGGDLQLAVLRSPEVDTPELTLASQTEELHYQYHWIGGASDRTREFGFGPTELMRYVAEHFAAGTDGQDYYWGHQQYNQIADRIREFHDEHGDAARIVLVGHSWGGASAMRVTRMVGREGIPIDTLLTLDPVSTVDGGAGLRTVTRHVNVHPPTDWVDDLARFALIGRFFALLFIAPSIAPIRPPKVATRS